MSQGISRCASTLTICKYCFSEVFPYYISSWWLLKKKKKSHKLGGFKQYTFILLQFWSQKFKIIVSKLKSARQGLAPSAHSWGRICFLCFFQRLELHSWHSLAQDSFLHLQPAAKHLASLWISATASQSNWASLSEGPLWLLLGSPWIT